MHNRKVVKIQINGAKPKKFLVLKKDLDRNFSFNHFSTSGDNTDGKLSKAEGGGNDSSDNKSNEDENGIGILETMLDNLDAFVIEPTPQGCVVKCRITRDRKGMDRGKFKGLNMHIFLV